MAHDEAGWIRAERQHAEDYLQKQRVSHLGIGARPAFHVYPYLALWAVQSRVSPGSVGWWTITGDFPADHISSSEGRNPRDALRAFARQWHELSAFMLRGERHPNYSLGTPDQWPELGELLQRRAHIVQIYADDESIWRDNVV